MPLPFMSPQVSQRQIDWRGILSVMDSPHNDTELHRWLRWVSESRKPPYFVCTVVEAALVACMPDYLLLRPVLLELKRQHPEPEPGSAAPADPELSQWLRWASERGNTPTFVRTVAEAALMACSPDYVLLRPVLVELKRRYPGG